MEKTEVNQIKSGKRTKSGGRSSCLHDGSIFISRLSAQFSSMHFKYNPFCGESVCVFMGFPPTVQRHARQITGKLNSQMDECNLSRGFC